MALKIRLRQQGRHNLQVYRLVVTDARAPRDGKYLEMLGWYDPNRPENGVHVEAERVNHWLDQGAIPTEKAQEIIRDVAPEVLKSWKEKQLAVKARLCEKKRNRRKEKAAS